MSAPKWSMADERSLQSFEMISPAESRVRRVVGVLLELLLLVALATSSFTIPYGLQNSLHSAAFVVYRMGVESQ